MPVIINPSLAPDVRVDITNALVAAIAHELHRVHQGNDVLNWLEAERILTRITRQSVIEAQPTERSAERGERVVEPQPERCGRCVSRRVRSTAVRAGV